MFYSKAAQPLLKKVFFFFSRYFLGLFLLNQNQQQKMPSILLYTLV